MNFDTALSVLKSRLAELDGRIPLAQRREAELRSELERVTGRLDDMLQERGTIIRAIEDLGGACPDDPGEFDLNRVCQRCWLVHPERACDR